MKIFINTFIALLLLTQSSYALAQSAAKLDSIAVHKSFFRQNIAPITLVGLGVLANNSQLEQDFQTNLRNRVGNDFEFKIDDYLQFAPIGMMYIADLCGVQAKNHWFDQSKYAFMSEVLTVGVVYGLKQATNKTRPNGASHAFPSGHTAFAFTNAAVLFNEFQDSAPLLAYSGYVLAGTTGAFRMINNKHWLSDVLTGAGIGILATELIYHFEPLKNFNPFKKSNGKPNGITLLPKIQAGGNYGFYFAYQLN